MKTLDASAYKDLDYNQLKIERDVADYDMRSANTRLKILDTFIKKKKKLLDDDRTVTVGALKKVLAKWRKVLDKLWDEQVPAKSDPYAGSSVGKGYVAERRAMLSGCYEDIDWLIKGNQIDKS